MSVFFALFGNKFYNFEQAFKVKDITSDEMKDAIRDWFTLYSEGDAPKEEDECQRLPVAIVNKLTKTVFSEYEASIRGSGAKAQFMTTLLDRLTVAKKVALQQALVGGECFVKPVLTVHGFEFSPL